MDTRDRLVRAIRNPRFFFRYINRFYHTRDSSYNRDGMDVFSEDWDNLIILDACRYDVFEKLYDEEAGTLEKRVSRGSATDEFLRANLDGREFPDTVYVTANPQYEKNYREGKFHDVYSLFKSDSWDKGSRTVLPDVFVDRATDIYRQHTDKRIVFHVIQPHNPFIGDFGEKVIEDDELSFWNRVTADEFDYEDRELYAAYIENVVIVLKHVRDLLEELEGKSVITADHGQMIGERSTPVPAKEYGHPKGIYTPELVEVPWFETESGDRRAVSAGEIAQKVDIEDDVVNERLEDLGYV